MEKGIEILRSNRSSLDATEIAIRSVEDNPEADSVGTGGLPNIEGNCELDASIMVGNSLHSGAVSCLRMTQNPISVARKVLELSPHVMLCGDGATRFARAVGFPEYDPLTQRAKEKWIALRNKMYEGMKDEKKFEEFNSQIGYDVDLRSLVKGLEIMISSGAIKEFGTVGTIALDNSGIIVAGTSTSGWALRLPGRVSDSSVIGAGTYANKFGGASSTGMGEIAIRHNLTRQVCDYLEQGYHPKEACEESLKKMLRNDRISMIMALIALDREGRVGGATTKEPFVYQYQKASDKEVTVVRPTPVSI